jgi:hypothetical protein
LACFGIAMSGKCSLNIAQAPDIGGILHIVYYLPYIHLLYNRNTVFSGGTNP